MSQLPHPVGERFASLPELPANWNGGHPRFADRRDAGRRLAAVLGDFRYEDPVVVGIPPGGMAVAADVARALGAPLDVAALCPLIAPEDRSRSIVRIILALPLAESGHAIEMRQWVDQLVCLVYRREPRAVRVWCDDFSETTEDEIAAVLSEHVGAREREVEIEEKPPGTRDQLEAGKRVASLAIEWLTQHLTEAAPVRERRRVALA